VRVISGTARGRRLTAPLGKGVRPTSDRVKEAMFDILYSLGGVEDLDVLDLFCGSGALGIEALSRGARHVTFVDAELTSIKAVEDNVRAVGLDLAACDRHRAVLPGWTSTADFDLVLADPPYDFDGWEVLLGSLRAPLAILESNREVPVPAPWSTTRPRHYGTTLLSVLRAGSPEAAR
jgi:16S rRNA (guanine966-N2)-methyltransferase